MNLTNALLTGFTFMLMLSLLLGFKGRKRSTSSIITFFWGDNKVPRKKGIHLLLSTPFSLNGLLYQIWLGYLIGWAAVILQIIWCLSYILMATQAKKISSLAKENTLHGSIGKVFGSKAETAAAFASVIGFTLQIGWELIVGVSIFGPITQNNTSIVFVLIISLALIGAVYSIIGGLRGNATANEIQNIWAGLSIFGVVLFLIFWWTNTGTASANLPFDGGSFSRMIINLGIGGFLTNCIFSLCWQFVDMGTWQTISATEESNEKSTKGMLFWSALWIFIFPGVVGTVIGMWLRTVPSLSSDTIIATLVEVVSQNVIFTIFVVAGFVATMLSTIDGLMLAASQAFTWDIFKQKEVNEILKYRSIIVDRSSDEDLEDQIPKEIIEKDKSLLRLSRIIIIVLALIGSGLIFLFTNTFGISIFDLVYIVVIAQMVLVPTVISVLFFSERERRFGFLSILSRTNYWHLFSCLLFNYKEF